MFDEFVQWLESIVGPSYQYSRGMWVDHPSLNDAFICAVHSTGGPAIDVDDRRPRYRVILLGPRKGRQYAARLQADIESLVQAAMGGAVPCGAASMRVVTEPAGPGYTNEDRAWYSLDLQLTF